MTQIQKDAVEKIMALRKLTTETGCITSRTQNRLLQQLSDDDLAIVARELAQQQNSAEKPVRRYSAA